jgi:hypothetical protein
MVLFMCNSQCVSYITELVSPLPHYWCQLFIQASVSISAHTHSSNWFSFFVATSPWHLLQFGLIWINAFIDLNPHMQHGYIHSSNCLNSFVVTGPWQRWQFGSVYIIFYWSSAHPFIVNRLVLLFSILWYLVLLCMPS